MNTDVSKTHLTKRRGVTLSLLLAFLLPVFSAGPGARVASAQETPAPQTLTVYHSTNPIGTDPRPEYPPGCEAPGSGGGGMDSGFDSFYDTDSGFDPGPGFECVLQGTTYEELELWVSGGDDATTEGTVCKMGTEGGNGDEVCGANISFNLSGAARFRSFIPMMPTLVIGAECVPSEGTGCVLPAANAKDLTVNFRRGTPPEEGMPWPPAGPRRLGSLIVDSSEFLSIPDADQVLITASGEAATASLQLLEYGKPDPVTPEVIALLPVPEPGGTLQLLSGALGLVGLCRLRRRP